MRKFFKNVFRIVKKNLTLIIILFIFLFLFICDNTSLSVGNLIMGNLKSIATSFTPTTDLFDDGSEVSFVSYFFGMKAPNKKDEIVNFYLPSSSPNISSSNEYLIYSYDGVLNAVANGQVTSIGYTKDNEKYIEIEHSSGYVSRYIGVQSVGVATGQIVSAKNPIAVASYNQSVKVLIQQKGNIVKTSEVEWKS